MPYCCVRKCSNSWKKQISMHRLPTNVERRQQWMANIVTLVLMLGDIFTRWKIPVAYHFTPKSVDGALLKPIIEEIIKKAESISLLVHSLTSDMAPVNLDMWKVFGGIVGNRN